MRRGEGILRVLRKHLHNKLSPHTMPNWVRRDLIVLVVVLAVHIPHSHIGQSYVQRTHTWPTLLQLSNNCSKLIFATIMQLKSGHGYFRSYLHRLKDYNSSKCTNLCNERQTPEHLLLNCIHYFEEIQIIKQNVDTTINLNMLFNTKIGNDILINFIVKTKIATRKWILGQLEDEIVETGGWGEIEQ